MLNPLPSDTMLPPPTSTYNVQSSPLGYNALCRPVWDTPPASVMIYYGENLGGGSTNTEFS
ncbi:hypothetical protein GBAR_LOCUS26854, partial [Geodia barretti]